VLFNLLIGFSIPAYTPSTNSVFDPRFLGKLNSHSLTRTSPLVDFPPTFIYLPIPLQLVERSHIHTTTIMAYTQHDQTFFVESDEPHLSNLSARDAAKMIARTRQDVIAGELSRLAGEEYLEDIMEHMKHMEVSDQ
jgi:hypothetical protein